MQTPYPKPKQFSDPYQDWMGSKQTLDSVLAKDKGDLCLSDYNVIFARNLPAADYEEGAYYLDSCFSLMRRKANVVESDICESLFWFVDHHRDALRRDGLLEPCLHETAAVFQDYLSSFELMRLSDLELAKYHVDPRFREMPQHSRAVNDLLDSLLDYRLYSGVLNDILGWLNEDVAHKSCWWIEMAYHARWWYVTYDGDDEADPRRQTLMHRLLDLRDYSFHMWKHITFVREAGYEQYEKRVSIT